MALAVFIHRAYSHAALLRDCYLVIATILATLAAMLGLDAMPTLAIWALEGVALVWLGQRQASILQRLAGYGLFLLAVGSLLVQWPALDRSNPWFNEALVALLVLSVTMLAGGWLLQRSQTAENDWDQLASRTLHAGGVLAWLALGTTVLVDLTPDQALGPRLALFAVASALVIDQFGRFLQWRLLRLQVFPLPLVIAFGAGHMIAQGVDQPFLYGGWWAWPLTFAGYFTLLLLQERDGLTQTNDPRYLFGWLLMLGLATWAGLWLVRDGQTLEAMGLALLGLIAATLRFALRERSDPSSRPVSAWIAAWSMLLWVSGAGKYVATHFSGADLFFALLLMSAITVALLEILGSLARWNGIRQWQALLLLALVAGTGAGGLAGGHPLAGLGLVAVPIGLLSFWLILWHVERDGPVFAPGAQHLLGALAVVWILAWELAHQLASAGSALQTAAIGGVLAATLLVTGQPRRQGAPTMWPLARHQDVYGVRLPSALVIIGVLWTLVANLSDVSGTLPPPYLPLANGLDVAQAALLIGTWRFFASGTPPSRDALVASSPTPILWMTGFVWLNGLVFRSFHYWTGVPYELSALYAAVNVQAVLSLLWTTCAFACMWWASRRASRLPWMAGAALLAVVIVKLFFHDLANSDTVARIVTFIGVGILLLGIGYVAPVPPGRDRPAERAA